MRTFWVGSAAAVLAAALPAAAGAERDDDASRASQRSGAWIPVAGTVVSIDRVHHTVGLRHAALETLAAGTEYCRFTHPNAARYLRPGQDITAVAETDRHPWLLDNVRVMSAKK